MDHLWGIVRIKVDTENPSHPATMLTVEQSRTFPIFPPVPTLSRNPPLCATCDIPPFNLGVSRFPLRQEKMKNTPPMQI